MLKIAVTFDFHDQFGFFLKSDLIRRLSDLGVSIIPLFYNQSDLSKATSADGILIPGGLSDVDPLEYGEKTPHPKTKVLRSRYEFEKRLLDQELQTKKPILCICWGMQTANVYFGGSLIQHIPDERPSPISHEQKEAAHLPTHHVQLVKGSPAIDLWGTDRLHVNSTHHQGVDRIGADLLVEGHSEDQLVECLRLKNHPYFWAVQWHPERLENDPVIPSFLTACRSKSH